MKTFALFPTLLAAGCATMINRPLQEVPVTSSPSHAAIELACTGQEPRHAGYTPTTISIPRDADGCRITLSKLGYAERTIRFERVRSVVTELNAIPGLALGAVTALVALPAELALPEPIGERVGNSAFAAGASVPDKIDERTGTAFEQVPTRVAVDLVPRP